MSRVALPREESRRCLQYGDALLELGVLALEFADLGRLLSGDAPLRAGIDPALTYPLAECRAAQPEPRCDRGDGRPLRGLVAPVLDYQPDRLLLGLCIPLFGIMPSLPLKKVCIKPGGGSELASACNNTCPK